MKLSDIMSHAGLSFYAEVGLVIFLGAFVALVIQLCARRNRAAFERARWLPLQESGSSPAGQGSDTDGPQ